MLRREDFEAKIMGSLGGRPRALLIPWALQGHWDPMKIFIRQLVSRNISFTVLSSPERISELQALKDNGEFAKLDYVGLVEAFSDPGKEKFVYGAVAVKKMMTEYLGQPHIMKNLIAQKASGCGPTFLMADMFMYWSQEIADELGIPRYTFFTSPTTFALAILHAKAIIAEEFEPPGSSDRAKREKVINYPGLELFRVQDLPMAFWATSEAYKKHSEYLPKAAGIVINSFEAFEGAEAVALRTQLERLVGNAKVPNIFLIGPVLSLPTYPILQSKKEPAPKTDNSECLTFLHTQPAASVLYICFGTQAELNQSSITELARGLELSEVSFLWVLPRPQKASPSWAVSQSLPAGFGSRTEGRGLAWTGWAPQREILDHPSVGGFVTHCGWNSLVEAMHGGVPIIPWPLFAEQHLNARFMVTVAKVGVEIQKTADGEFVGAEIAKAVRLLMMSDEGKEQRLKMQALKDASRAAGVGGSSTKALDALLEEVANLPN